MEKFNVGDVVMWDGLEAVVLDAKRGKVTIEVVACSESSNRLSRSAEVVEVDESEIAEAK
jgi:hypothetical protein